MDAAPGGNRPDEHRSSARARAMGTAARSPGALHFHLAADLDDLVRRNREELGRRARIAGEEEEERPPPARQLGATRRHEGLAAEEVARAPAERLEPLRRRAAHDVGHPRRLHEAVARDDAPEAAPDLPDLDALARRHDRRDGGP